VLGQRLMPKPPALPWAIILAGGEGRRLASLTRALYGRELTKQFAVLAKNRLDAPGREPMTAPPRELRDAGCV
jgi:hypothetical protein